MPSADDPTFNLPDPNEQVGISEIVKLGTELWLGDEGQVKVVSGYLYGPFRPPDNSNDGALFRFILYRTLALDEHIEFTWGDVVWIDNYPKLPAPEDGSENNPKLASRVTVWLRERARVSVGGFLVGDIAHMYMPPEDVTVLFGQRDRQFQDLLIAGSIAGCSTNPNCSGKD